MSRNTLLCSAIVVAAAITSARAAEPIAGLDPVAEVVRVAPVAVPAGATHLPTLHPTRLAEINRWIAETVDVPAATTLPNIALVPAAQIVSIRMGGRVAPDAVSASGAASWQTETVAIYVDESETVYLKQGWTGESAAEMSVLVHELVHHLQNQATLRYACQQERERLAYKAQSLWLARYDLTLESEFEIDPFSLLIHTRCLD